MEFKGSRNFTSEQVYDMVWECPVGTKIYIEVLEEDKVLVRKGNEMKKCGK